MKALLEIASLWRGRAGLLAAGIALSLAALLCGVALLTVSGAGVAALAAGLVFSAGAWLALLGPARVLLRYGERLLTHDATFRALADLRVWFFRGLAGRASLGLGFRRAGDLLARLVGDVEALDGLYLRILLPTLGALVLIPVATLAAWRVAPAAGLATLAAFLAATCALPVMSFRWAVLSGRELSAAASGLRVAALDTLSGLREVRAFGAEARMATLVDQRGTALAEAQERLARRTAWANAAALLCGQAALIAVLLTAGGAPLVAVAACFLLVASFDAVAGLPRAWVAAGSAAASAGRVLEVGRPIGEPVHPAHTKLPDRLGLRFAGVHFAWGQDQPAVFDSLTLDVPAGARVAVLGPSGVGKSTLAALALKVVQPDRGRVLLGGMDVADLADAEVHSRIAWLSQRTHLFDDTIRANLRLGRPGATDAELWRALDRAALGDMVRSLPDQLDSWIGEGGARLSGGQARRVALARTLLQRTPLLILDEPCAGLDADTEREFLGTLFAETTGQTMILIAHRLTGAERLDRIWRLSAGHAVAAAA